MTRIAIGHLPALALLATLVGCASRAPFELPDLDGPASASAQVTPQGAYPAYRYGYGPYGLYGPYGYGQPGSSRHPRVDDGSLGAAPGPVVVEQPPPPPPRPRNVERQPQERPARTTKAADDSLPARRQQER